MYPSQKQPYFGTFVESFKNGLESLGFNFSGIVAIYSKGHNLIGKVYRYVLLFIKLIFYSFFKTYDVIYIHFLGIHAYFCLLVSLILPFKKLIVNIHGSDILGSTIQVRHNLLKYWVLKKSVLIVVPSLFFKKKLICRYPKFQDKIIISPSGGVDKKIFFPKVSKKKSKNDLFKIGFASRIIEGKGWNVLLEAFESFVKLVPNSHLYIAGAGKDEEKVLKCIEKLKIQSKVTVLGGLPRESLGEFMRSLDIFVFPTLLFESLGLVALEAMSCGVPVIASKRGGIVDYVKDGLNGFLITPGSVNELIEKLYFFYNLEDNKKDEIIQRAIQTGNIYDSNQVNYELSEKLKLILK